MASKSNYLEDWQLQCGEIKQRGAHLLKSQVWSDCSFVVGDLPNHVTIKAHKLILAMASPVFEAMFYGLIAEGNSPISIPDIHPDTFQKLMEYIYTDNIELDSIDNAFKLYYGAQKYMLTHLLTVCSMYLSCNITPDVVCKIYEFAIIVGEENIIKECEQIIQTETSSVLNHKSFEELSLDTVENIFTMDSLNITNELELFKAAERYAKALNINEFNASPSDKNMEMENITENEDEKLTQTAVDAEKNMEANKSNEENETNEVTTDHNNFETSFSKEQNQELDIRCKYVMKKVVQHIRFLTLTATQLAEYPTLSTLLTDSEILGLIMNAASANTNRPMPQGFSISKTKR